MIDGDLKYQLIFENAPVGMTITTRQGDFLTANKAFLNDTLYTFEELRLIKAVDLYEDPNARQGYLSQVDELGTVSDYEVNLRRKDGTIFPGLLNADPIQYEGVNAFLTSIRNISALKESEAKHRSIIESIPIGLHLYELKGDGRLVFIGANPAADNLLGVDNSQFIGKTIEEAFPPLANTEIPTRYREAASRGIPWTTEQIQYADEKIQGAFVVHAFQYSSNRMVASFLDTTASLTAKVELEKTKRRAEFFTDLMAHDLNNIHQGILASLELMTLEENHTSNFQDMCQAALDQLQRGIRLISNVRKLSEIEKLSYSLRPLDLYNTILEIMPIVKYAFPQKEIEINIELSANDFTVFADELLGDVFYNLLHNSVKVDEKEKVLISIKVRPSNDTDFIEVSVEDSGPGIPNDRKETIFRRLEHGTISGSGMGLTLVSSIVKFYGGSVWIEDRIPEDFSQGARFVLRLPLFVENEEQ